MKIELTDIALTAKRSSFGPVDILSAISLTVQAGEKLAVIGPSGAGKTSLLNVIACAQRPNGGRLLLDDVDPWALSRRQLQRLRGRLFLAPQVAPLVQRQRVVTSVLAGRLPQWGLIRSLVSLCYPSDIEGARQALSQFDLSEKIFDRVDRLSGGERQRVGLARGLLSGAQLLLVDEPLSALDPQRGEQALAALCTTAEQQHATLVVSLHHVDMALKFFTRIVGVAKGQIYFDLPVAQVTPDILSNLYQQSRPVADLDDAHLASEALGSDLSGRVGCR